MSLTDHVPDPPTIRNPCVMRRIIEVLPEAEVRGLIDLVDSGRTQAFVAERINTDPDVQRILTEAFGHPVRIDYQSIGRHRGRKCAACRITGKEFS